MSLKRIMPCLLLQNKRLVKTIKFSNSNYIGDPINAVKIYNDKEVDELVLLDINVSKINSEKIDFDLIKNFSKECFMPLAYGGGVRTINDFKKLFNIGIEKIIVNTLIFDNPKIVKIATEKYGSQSIVASIDVKKNSSDNYIVFSHSNRKVKHDFKKFINYVIKLNVGEILITSVDQDGTWDGYDEKLIDYVNKITSVPIIANGGCGRVEDLKNILYKTGIQAAALGSMAVYQKKGMGVLIRFPKRNKIIIDE